MEKYIHWANFLCILALGLSTALITSCVPITQELPTTTNAIVTITNTMTTTNTPAPPTATPTPAPSETRHDDKGIEQVWVPPGSFLMGTGDTIDIEPPSWAERELASERPQHKVVLTKGYWIDTYEVTNAAYHAFIEDGGYLNKSYWSEEGWNWLSRKDVKKLPFKCVSNPQSDHPQVCVTWYEAQAYANWRGGRLPTEAEWEFAARGPESNIYPWGNEWDPSKANVEDSEDLTPVGSYPDGVSWIGAHDLAGNAMEWVQDWLDTHYYESGEMVDPQGPEKGGVKIEKGGWWNSHPYVARSAYRHFEDPPKYQDHHIGFRVVTPQEQK